MSEKSGPKRFYQTVAVDPRGKDHAITLDGRPLRTPKGQPFQVPFKPLAEAIAVEWQSQPDRIDLRSMPLTGLANAALDHVTPDPARFRAEIAAFAKSDLLCYRAEEPETLAMAQRNAWDPLLAWLAERHGAKLRVGAGVMPFEQPPAAMATIETVLGTASPFELAGLQAAVMLLGSVVLSLALKEGRLDATSALAAARIDETFQAERWGKDPEAEARAAAMARDLTHAARFLGLLSQA